MVGRYELSGQAKRINIMNRTDIKVYPLLVPWCLNEGRKCNKHHS
jgi:hypothetical protein